jgi:hypothetical protein
MSDARLLEKAAKVAGIEVIGPMGDDGLQLFDGRRWNPLTDDGDALRLLVKIGDLDLDGILFVYGDTDYSTEPTKALRRAIVRCAAGAKATTERG